MKVLLLTDADVFAGTECHMLVLATELVRQGVDARLASPPGSVISQRSGPSGVNHIGLAKGKGLDFSAIVQLSALLKRGNVDVIHTHNGRTAFLAAAAVHLAKRGNVVASQHFLHPAHTGQRGLRRLFAQAAHRWVYRTAFACIAVSRAVRDALLARGQIEPQKVRVIPHGISVNGAEESDETRARIRQELDIAPGVPLVMCVARLEAEKDVATLIAAMSTVRKDFPESRCVLVGEGEERASLMQQVNDAGLGQCVTFLGFRSDASRLIAACDLFVLPSLAESFGLVLLEAMVHSKPVISTRTGGAQEVVVHEETGLLVPLQNPAALASAITSLLIDQERACKFGQQGRKRLLDLYTAERMARETAAVYREALNRVSPAERA